MKRILIGLVVSITLALGGIVLVSAPAHASLADTAGMSKSEYKRIKKGMSYQKVKKIVGGKGDCRTWGKTRTCEWRYRGDLGFAAVTFSKKTGKAKEKWWLGWH